MTFMYYVGEVTSVNLSCHKRPKKLKMRRKLRRWPSKLLERPWKLHSALSHPVHSLEISKINGVEKKMNYLKCSGTQRSPSTKNLLVMLLMQSSSRQAPTTLNSLMPGDARRHEECMVRKIKQFNKRRQIVGTTTMGITSSILLMAFSISFETALAVYTLRISTTLAKKMPIDRNMERTRMPFEVTKSRRDFSQKPRIASFSCAYLLPPITFFGSNPILFKVIDMWATSSGVARMI